MPFSLNGIFILLFIRLLLSDMNKLKFEKIHHPLAKRNVFIQRIVFNFLIAVLLLVFSLLMGILGYHHYCELEWADALLNASMILSGMGPVNATTINGCKIFSSIYAIYSGVAFLTSFAILISPIYHRFLHRFHIDDEQES